MKRNSYSEKGQYHEGEGCQKTKCQMMEDGKKEEDIEDKRETMHK